MEAPLIHVTRDYNLFRFHKQNRPVGSNKKIERSITEIDLTPYVPVIVDKDYFIIDGQNRFAACKKLGKPIFYVVMSDSFSTDDAIIALNKNQKMWRQEEYLHFQAATRGGCYKDLEDFFKEHSNFGISNVMVIYPDKAINANTLRINSLWFYWASAKRVIGKTHCCEYDFFCDHYEITKHIYNEYGCTWEKRTRHEYTKN